MLELWLTSLNRMEFFYILKRTVIILFCIYHMAAVGLFSIPMEDAAMQPLRQTVLPYIHPYLLITSQWQQWNMFAPDPLRRVTEFAIEMRQGGAWVLSESINPKTIPWWRDDDELKLLRHLEIGEEKMEPLRLRYLEMHCREKNFPAGTTLRLMVHWYIIQKPPFALPVDKWGVVSPTWHTKSAGEFTCL